MRLATTLVSLITALAAFATPAAAQAQTDYPTRPVRLIVPFPAGGVTDIIGRLVAQQLSERWGQQVIVDNRAGAGGNLGTEMGARAAADGYTLTLGSIATAISQSLYAKLGYDLAEDFTPVALLTSSPLVLLARPSLPADDLSTLLAYARAHPGSLNFASSGSGSSFHLAGEMLKSGQKLDIIHVPYKGGAPATHDLMAGQVDIMFNNIVEALPHVRSGKLKALAITSAARSPLAPELRTMAEQGLADFVVTPWFGILVPKQTPPALVARLNADLNAVMRTPEVRARLDTLGAEAGAMSAGEFASFVRAETERWATIVKAAGARVN